MKTKVLKIVFLAAVALLAVNSAEANGCSFYRDLGVGARGEDVRCLQQYLSTWSYITADGSFGPMTRQAVVNWQLSNGVPASGYFDALSRSQYFEVTTVSSIPVVGSVLGYTFDNTVNTSTSSEEVRAKEKIKDAIDKIQEARDDIDDASGDTSEAEDSYDDAEDDLFDAVIAYLKMDFRRAYNLASDAENNADDASDDADNDSDDSSDRSRARAAMDDAEDAIDDAEDEIADARRLGHDVRDAEDTLDDANDKLDDAEDEFDDENYDDAKDLAEDAEDLANDAVDDID